MRIKLDENLPARLTGLLRGLGHDIDTVLLEGLQGVDDESSGRPSRKPAGS